VARAACENASQSAEAEKVRRLFVSFVSLAFAGALLAARPAQASVVVSGASVFVTDANGQTKGPFNNFWGTRGGDTGWNLWLSQGTSITAPFLNGPADTQAAISMILSDGQYTFTGYGTPGGTENIHGLNLFFSGLANPKISAFAPTTTSGPPFPSFTANSNPQTSGLDESFVPGSGSLIYSNGGTTVQLTEFFWARPAYLNVDRVGRFQTAPDGQADFVGRFTIVVSSVPEPSSAAALAAVAYCLTSARRRTGKRLPVP
jgi:hypothetical protein